MSVTVVYTVETAVTITVTVSFGPKSPTRSAPHIVEVEVELADGPRGWRRLRLSACGSPFPLPFGRQGLEVVTSVLVYFVIVTGGGVIVTVVVTLGGCPSVIRKSCGIHTVTTTFV